MLARRTPTDIAPAVPTLGRWASLRFAYDPDGFLSAGRALGRRFYYDVGPFFEPWAFHLDGRRVLVVGSREAADAVLRGPTRFYRGEVLAPLLGRASPLLDLVRRPDAAPEAGDPYRSAAPSHPPADMDGSALERIIEAEVRHAAYRRAWAPSFDVAPALTRAAVQVALRALGVARHGFNVEPHPDATAAAWALLDAADTPALVVPGLRRWSPRWRRLAGAREAFLRAVGLPTWHEFQEELGTFPWVRVTASRHENEREQDRAVTTLVGAVDAPVALALDALVTRGPAIKRRDLDDAEAAAPGGARALFARRRVAAALEQRGPIPLLLREVVREVEVPGLGLLQPGAAVAVDAASASFPLGWGPHACTGARLGRAFAEAAVRVCSYLGLEVARRPGRRVRRRLVATLPTLWMRATGAGRLRIE